MKTLMSMFFFLMMLSGSFSYGAGNETCYPDTSKAQLVTASAQQQMDYLQVESYKIFAHVPTSQANQLQKLVTEKLILEIVQMESETIDGDVPVLHVRQLNCALKNRLPVQ